MIFSFFKIVKTLFKQFSERDYSVLNTRWFASCWIGFTLDRSLTSTGDLFGRLKLGGYEMDISTFSQPNQPRNLVPFQQRRTIELFGEFLKMSLDLDRLICQNPNGIEIQIYSHLIAYLILLLIDILKMRGDNLLDKLRYLPACMCQEFGDIHQSERILQDRSLLLLMGISESIV
ncbi:hypothetical protein V0288_22275 [Pannus brasiliensis CCIBt3594]|uniref:Transposase n=1 Tax=Pannus brasiliensis CCIBt3594 TaxID=1427578 RepID=A0AAW9QWT3_9CHRO